MSSVTRPGVEVRSPAKSKDLVLLLLAMTQFLVVIDASIVNVALPSIGRDLAFAPESLSWVFNAYTLTFGGFLLLGGRMADLLGRRRMFIVGMGLFSFASLLGGFAQNETQLLLARAAQGLGAAIVSPAALSIITTTFAEGAERNRALGVWGAVAGAGGAAGVLLGGVLTEYLNWRWVLFVNVPLGTLAVVAAPRLLSESKSPRASGFDALGALLVTASLALLVYAFVDAVEVGWGSSTTLVRILAGVALLSAFVVVEARHGTPLIPLSILRLRTLRGANAVGLLIGMSLFSMFFFISLYLQEVLAFSAIEAGLAFLPLAVTIILSAGAASAFVTRLGFKPTLAVGALFVAAGLAWFSRIDADGSFVIDVLGPSIVAAVGFGLTFVAMTIAAVTGTESHEAGLASGLITSTQQIGGAVGLAILASIAGSSTRSAESEERATALTDGFSDAFLVGSGIALVAVLFTLLLISSGDSRDQAKAAREGKMRTP